MSLRMPIEQRYSGKPLYAVEQILPMQDVLLRTAAVLALIDQRWGHLRQAPTSYLWSLGADETKSKEIDSDLETLHGIKEQLPFDFDWEFVEITDLGSAEKAQVLLQYLNGCVNATRQLLSLLDEHYDRSEEQKGLFRRIWMKLRSWF